MTVNYTPKGVCSRNIRIELDDEKTITEVVFTGGCAGNTQGVAALIKGMNAEEAIKRLSGIDCKGKGTSCPDQLSKALQKALMEVI